MFLVFTFNQLLNYRVHIGDKLKILWYGFYFNYIYGFKNNYFFINLKFTILNFRNSIYLIKKIIINNLNILLVSQDFLLYNRIDNELNYLNLFGFFYIHYKWIAGFVSNFKFFISVIFQILFRKIEIKNNLITIEDKNKWLLTFNKFKGLCFCTLLPSLIISLNLSLNYWSIFEGYKLSIPTTSIIDLNFQDINSVTYKIPGNTDSKISLIFYLLIFKNAFLLGYFFKIKYFLFLLVINFKLLKYLNYKKYNFIFNFYFFNFFYFFFYDIF